MLNYLNKLQVAPRGRYFVVTKHYDLNKLLTKVYPYVLTSIQPVEIGFKSNGGSIPRIFWVILTPFSPLMLLKYVVHDVLCDRQLYQLADIVLNELLKNDPETKKWRRFLVMFGVRIWHNIAYSKSESLTDPQPVRKLFSFFIT